MGGSLLRSRQKVEICQFISRRILLYFPGLKNKEAFMKKTILLVLFTAFLLPILLLSCKGDKGPQGSTGPVGYSIIFQQNGGPTLAYTGAADNRIGDQYYKNYNYGGSGSLYFGNAAGSPDTRFRFLVKFDLAGYMPSNAEVTSANITLSLSPANAICTKGVTLSAYAISVPWQEGTIASNPNTPDGSTWVSPTTTAQWVNQGGDFNNTPCGGPAYADASSTYVTVPISTATINTWRSNPSFNNGVMLVSVNELSGLDDYIAIFTKEWTTVDQRPKLTVYYTLQ
jgi:hypothetical protein